MYNNNVLTSIPYKYIDSNPGLTPVSPCLVAAGRLAVIQPPCPSNTK